MRVKKKFSPDRFLMRIIENFHPIAAADFAAKKARRFSRTFFEKRLN